MKTALSVFILLSGGVIAESSTTLTTFLNENSINIATITDSDADFVDAQYIKAHTITSFDNVTLTCDSVDDTVGVLFSSGSIYDEDEGGIGSCAALCYSYNLEVGDSTGYCQSFNQVFNESSTPSLYSCELRACDSSSAFVVNSTADYARVGWVDSEFTPIVKGLFKTSSETTMYEYFEVLPGLTCDSDPRYVINSETSIASEDCSAECLTYDGCVGFDYNETQACTLFRVCDAMNTTTEFSYYFARRISDGHDLEVHLDTACVESDIVNKLYSTGSATTLVSCNGQCRSLGTCFAFALTDDDCSLYTECSTTEETDGSSVYLLSDAPAPTPYPSVGVDEDETLPPTSEGGDYVFTSCNVNADCNSGYCFEGYCKCVYPNYGSTCQSTRTCNCT